MKLHSRRLLYQSEKTSRSTRMFAQFCWMVAPSSLVHLRSTIETNTSILEPQLHSARCLR
jgi:hypothetical protein